MNRWSLEGRTALVTGASRGIGKAIALALAEAGANVAISARNPDELEPVAADIRAMGRNALPVAANNGVSDDLRALVMQVKSELDPPDILVNNAGTNPVYGPVVDVSEKAWDKIFDVNLKGTFLLSQLVAAEMLARGSGSIINVASIAGTRPMTGLGAYCVSKAGIIMLTKVCAVEWAPMGVRVNCLAPGLIKTRFSQALVDTPSILEENLRMIPMGRVGVTGELVDAVLYFAGDASTFVTGQVLYVDGGSSAM